MYWNGRNYDQVTGWFVSSDPIGFAGGDTNLYRYAFNNPLRWTDPSGLEVNACGILKNVGKGLLGLGTGTVVLGILSGEGGKIGGTPLNTNEDYELALILGQQAMNSAGISPPPPGSSVPSINPNAGQPTIGPVSPNAVPVSW